MRRQKGFTLIELLIVVAIIGIIAAIAIPNLINAIQRGRQKRTMGDIRTLSTCVEAYATDWAFYPKVTDGVVNGLTNYTVPTYLRKLPQRDGWNNPLYWGGGLAALGLGGVLWWMMAGGSRRRSRRETCNWSNSKTARGSGLNQARISV